MDHPVASRTRIPYKFTFSENSLHVFNTPMWHTARDHSTWMINIARALSSVGLSKWRLKSLWLMLQKKIKMQYYFSSSKCIQHLYMTSMVVSCLRSFKIKTTQCCTTFELNRTIRMMPKSLRRVLKKIHMQYHSNAVSVKCIQHPNMTAAVVCCLRSSKMMKA